MIPADYKRLVLKLLGRTETGAVNWHPTSDEDEYVVYFDQFALSMRIYRDDHGPDTCAVTIRDSTGKKIDQFWLEENVPDEWPLAQRLFAAARRKALRVDEALEAILEELEGDQNVGLQNAPPRVVDEDDDIPF